MKPLNLLVLFFALSIAAYAQQGTTPEFSPLATSWAEGTIAGTEQSGRLILHGTPSEYARNYVAYQRDFYSLTPAERADLKRVEDLRAGYNGRLSYNWRSDNLKDLTFTVPNVADFMVRDESLRYGIDPNKWSYNDDKQPVYFDDLKIGDRVVVGFDDYNTVRSIFRINSRLGQPMESNVTLQTGIPPARSVTPVPQAPAVDNNMRGDRHIMNLSSNETNDTSRKAGSDSGHIMNSGSNSTNNINGRNPYALNDDVRQR